MWNSENQQRVGPRVDDLKFFSYSAKALVGSKRVLTEQGSSVGRIKSPARQIWRRRRKKKIKITVEIVIRTHRDSNERQRTIRVHRLIPKGIIFRQAFFCRLLPLRGREFVRIFKVATVARNRTRSI